MLQLSSPEATVETVSCLSFWSVEGTVTGTPALFLNMKQDILHTLAFCSVGRLQVIARSLAAPSRGHCFPTGGSALLDTAEKRHIHCEEELQLL